MVIFMSRPEPQKARLADNPFYRQLTQKGQPFHALVTAVVMPIDALSLEGVAEAAEEGLIIPILMGPQEQIQHTAKQNNISIRNMPIEHCVDAKSAAARAVEIVKEGKAEAIMKGHLPTHILLHEIVSDMSLRTDRRMSHVFVIFSKDYPKPLLLSDAAVNIDPNLEAKRDIVQNAIDLFHCIGEGRPKVALLSATEEVTSALPDTIEAAAISKKADRGAITGAYVDGPLAFDNAISKDAAKAKGIRSDVAGDADILITPDLQSGNMLYKQMRYMAGYEAAGIVMGARVPIILTSRAATAPTRLASCALAVLAVRHPKATGRMGQKEADKEKAA